MHGSLRSRGDLMPVTAEQAQMLTTLALACRPVGARRWDASGVMANIRKVADRELSGVILAVIQAAEDGGAETPGVIPAAGPHWRAPDPMRPTPIERFDPNEFCDICGLTEPRCRARAAWNEHEFVSLAVHRMAAETAALDAAKAVAGLRDIKATEPTPTPRAVPSRPALHTESASAPKEVR